MPRYRSRLVKTEEKKNYRNALFYIISTTVILIIFIFFGIPAIAKFAAFLTNIRKTTEPVSKSDTTAPITPQVDPIPEFTKSDKVDIRGYTEPGATVTIFHNSETNEVLTGKSGEFYYSLNLIKGKNTISFTAKDSAGNESGKTEKLSITLDKEPPELTISSPEDGSEYYGTKQKQIIIEGSTEEGATITINDRQVVVDSSGNFTYLTTLNEGDNNFNIKATDQAGNETESKITLKYAN